MTLHITDQDFDAQIAEGLTFVDFWAEWCGPCRMLGPVIDELATELDGKVKIAKLNIDENRVITEKFGVMSIPTMILFKDGEPVEKIQGFQPKEALKGYLESKI
ncbi:thioredoxin [Erysipelothrix sp. HDW6C]|uniref:thioredoxin n=1 Tax=Erysipelothrix sp. HDW6C TaxID=2714930 RepID=UPI00140AA94E|nr:thioredoxin [Erysipelothrix sp. HDW6C]QIK69741.1 thioredoxin [Erysipelothrix sp. HDW6C]